MEIHVPDEAELEKLNQGPLPGPLPGAVSAVGGNVILTFAKSVLWVGMTPDNACALALALIRAARSARAV
jgi:hypothetical protein